MQKVTTLNSKGKSMGLPISIHTGMWHSIFNWTKEKQRGTIISVGGVTIMYDYI